jgi:hypothetical protein
VSLRPRTTRRWLAVAAGLAGLCFVLSACGTAAQVASADRSSTPQQSTKPLPSSRGSTAKRPAAPRAGACRTMVPTDIPPPSNNTPTKPCSKRHTAVTYFVGTFRPALLTGPRATMSAFANQRCRYEFTQYLGGGQAAQSMSLLTYAYFYPAARQRAAKSNWFRCDAISGYALQHRLYPLPNPLRGILAKGVPDSVRTCYTRRLVGRSGSMHRGAWVACTARHAQRTIAALRLGDPSTRYLGPTKLRIEVSAWCKPKAQLFLGSPANFSWGYSWPSRSEWSRGYRFATCLAVTAR